MMRKFLVSLIAFLTLLTLTTLVVADNSLNVSDVRIFVDDFEVDGVSGVSVEAGDVVPVEIFFKAGKNATDVEVSAWVEGERSDAAEKDFADLIEGKSYHARLSLRFPEDLDETEEDLTLFVRIEADGGSFEDEFDINVQREPDKASIIFAETVREVEAGSSFPVDIVLKNLGRHELDDAIVRVSIPELGISRRAYFGDLVAVEDNGDNDDEDARERRIYLRIPSNVESGVYDLVIEGGNEDSVDRMETSISIAGAEGATKVIVPVKSREIAQGDTETYEVIIVNKGNSVGVYEVMPQTSENIVVSVDNPVVTVPAGESKTVNIRVKGLEEGTHSFGVDVTADNNLVESVALTGSVTGETQVSDIAILTIVLAIIFVVLLIVLIVLLTRKPTAEEELEESYY